MRADFVYRDYRDFYVATTPTPATGRVTRPSGSSYDLALVENSDDLEAPLRRPDDAGRPTAFGTTLDVGGNYTLSRDWGNFDGENVASGPVPFDVSSAYPEYRQESWNFPDGDLSIDQRHRARLWLNYRLPGVASA